MGVCDINGKLSSQIVCLLLLCVGVLAACRDEQMQGPQLVVSPTVTPRSTALPAIATALPPGIPENPLHMVVRPASGASVVTEAQRSALEIVLAEQSDLVVKVTVVDRYAEALAALCDMRSANVTVAWLDALTYQAAVAQHCGEPVMVVERDGELGDSVVLVTQSTGGISLSAGRDVSVCRISYDDYYSWLIPSLMLQDAGISVVENVEIGAEYASIRTMVDGLLDSECDIAGLARAEFDRLSGAQQEVLTVLAETPRLPYAILMYPYNLPLGERIRLDEALLAATKSSDGNNALRPFLNHSAVERVTEGQFDTLSDFLAQSGLDFSQLGD